MELALAHAKAWLSEGWDEHRFLSHPGHRVGVAAGVHEGTFYIKSDTYASGDKIYASTTVAVNISVKEREWLDKHFAVLPTYALAGGKDAALVATGR